MLWKVVQGPRAIGLNFGVLWWHGIHPSGIAVVEDTTAPKLRINHIYPNDLSITVEVGLEDPGDAYPALARCMATTKAGLQRVTIGESWLYHGNHVC